MESVIKKDAAFALPGEMSPTRAHFSRSIKSLWYRVSHWETWDWRLKYVPIAPFWIWMCIRARNPWFFSAANPSLTFGGFDGESKKEMYDLLPPAVYPRTILISPSEGARALEHILAMNNLRFPLAVKPDVGKMGLMFRKIGSLAELENYHRLIGCDYLIQEWVDYPLEVSVFYYRMPGSSSGTITGFVRKEFLEVVGDGQSTLWELILAYPRVQYRLDEMRLKHATRLHDVLRPGERYCLSPALNLSRGGKLVSLEHEKDNQLLEIFDIISNAGNLYYGRYDVKCKSVEDLRRGQNFSILEFNGSGAEPHHVYGNHNSLWKACSILVEHWNVLFAISRLNNRSGHRYWGIRKGWMFLKAAATHVDRLRELDRRTRI